MRKRQRLGQHFLTSSFVANKIVQAACITKKDVVLEIGTGHGILVPLLCEKAKKVISIESDYTLYKDATDKFSDFDNLRLLHDNGFKSVVKFSIFVSNLPYSKSRDAMEWLIQKNFSTGVVMVQKEFYEKLIAKRKERRAISVLVNYCCDIKKISSVNKNNFSPQPKVDSVIIKLTCKNKINKELVKTVNKLFSYKRKTIQNILKQFGINIQSDKRLEDLSGDEIINFAKKIIK